jgi:single-stranded DNA-binding protein
MNTVHLIGELVSPVAVNRDRITKRAWGKAIIAVPRGSKGAIDFVPVTLSNREAEMAARYLGDGSLVSIERHLHSAVRSELSGGELVAMRRSLWVIADRVTYLRLARRTEDRP